MIHPEYFGNPNNPFDEEVPHPEYLLWRSPIRNVTSKQILYMAEFQDLLVLGATEDGATRRSISFSATAPLHNKGIFLNDEPTDFEQEEDSVTWSDVLITLSDIISASNDIRQRQIDLNRPNNLPFGVAGIKNKGRLITDIVRLSLILRATPEPQAKLIAHTTTEGILAAQGIYPFVDHMDFHFVALARSIGRALNKLTEEDPSKVLYDY